MKHNIIGRINTPEERPWREVVAGIYDELLNWQAWA